MDEVLVGQIVKPHGVKGDLKVYPLTHNSERFYNLNEVILKKEELRRTFKVKNVRVQPDFVYLTLNGINTMDEAEHYRNWEVCINRLDVPPLEEGWYYFELEGMEVYEGQERLGTIIQIIETGSNDVYVVKGLKGEICIPALKSVVVNVDVPKKRMDVVLPPGLLEDNE